MQASFFDGKSAQEHRVELLFSPDWLLFSRSEKFEQWSRDQLEVIAFPNERPDHALVLAPYQGSEARLLFVDPDIIARFFSWAPEFKPCGRKSRRRRNIVITAMVASLCCIAMVGFFFTNPGSRLLVQTIPYSVEDWIGRHLEAAYLKDEARCADEEGDVALQELATRLWRSQEQGPAPSIIVVRSKDVNAFALPGNRIVLFSGLMTIMDKSEELAGVMAHEMGHLRLRHPIQNLLQSWEIQLVWRVAGGANLGNWSEQLVQNAFSREMESAADDQALTLLSNANIRSSGLADFFDRMTEKYGKLGPVLVFLSSHPDLPDRAKQAHAAAASSNGNDALSDVQWNAIKEMCD